ncbi:MAG: copper resistance protein CopC [Methylococcaceae bacterium]|nr:copper resistance protein CopC [Methylococcaceae bacterium]
MKKPIRLIFFICILLSPALSQAHAVVTQSSIHIAPVKADKATEVSLSFNSHIELALSRFILITEGDQQQAVKARNSNKAGEVLISIPALKTGEYALKFKVFATDGHLTEDIIRFKVIP